MLLKVDTIARTAEFDERAASMHLRPWQWKFLLAADGRTPLDDLARACGIDFETAADFVHETEALGLVDIVAQTLEQFRSLQPAPVVAPPFAATVAPAAPVVPPAPIASAPLTASFAPSVPVAPAPPGAPVAPSKKVSVSFDTFSTMFGETSALTTPVPAAAYAPPATESTTLDAYRLDASDALDTTAAVPHASSVDDVPSVDDLPFAFETPDHMVPLAARTESESQATTEADRATDAESANTVEPAKKKSVSFSLFAPTFGEATTSIDGAHASFEPEADVVASTHDEPFAAHDAHDAYVAHDESASTDFVDSADHHATDDASRFFGNGHATSPSSNGSRNGKVVSLDFGALSSSDAFASAPAHDVDTADQHDHAVSAADDTSLHADPFVDAHASSETSHDATDSADAYHSYDTTPAFDGAPRSEYGDLFGSTKASSDRPAAPMSFDAPAATNGHTARVEPDASAAAAAPEPTGPAAPKDDMLMRHFQVGQSAAPAEPSALGDQIDKANDLTGSLLRALGLKK